MRRALLPEFKPGRRGEETQQNPSRNTICFSVPCLPPLLISSHPASQHPSPSTVTMSNTDARCSRANRSHRTLVSRTSVPVSSPQKKHTSSVVPCPRLSDRRGMEGTGQLIQNDQNPLRLPLQCAGAASDR